MNPKQVMPWEEVDAWLRSKGFLPTSSTVDSGIMWVSKSKRHLTVINPVDDFYPNFLWTDLVRRANLIIP